MRAFGRGWRLPLHLGFLTLVLGGLFTMNGWDLPTYLGLVVLCLALQQWLAYQRICFELILDVFTAGASLVALAFFQPRPAAPRARALAPGTAALSPDLLTRSSREGLKRHIARPAWLTGQIISLALTVVVALFMLALIKNSLWLVVTFVITALGVQQTLIHLPDRPRAFTLLLARAKVFCQKGGNFVNSGDSSPSRGYSWGN